MIIETKNNITFLYPDAGKKLKMINATNLYGVVILSKDDIVDNYEEVDELWTPDLPEQTEPELPEIPDVTPDSDGKISYEDARNLVDVLRTMQSRVIDMQKTNDMLTECVLEMSEVVYDA